MIKEKEPLDWDLVRYMDPDREQRLNIMINIRRFLAEP